MERLNLLGLDDYKSGGWLDLSFASYISIAIGE
jgi:hypothetical protein